MAFKSAFINVLAEMDIELSVIEKLWNDVEHSYSKRSRYYHTLSHLDSLVTELEFVRDKIDDWPTIVLSIAYHDIIYNPVRKDNEEKSAGYGVSALSSLNIPVDKIKKCETQIIATKSHASSNDSDTNYLIDADLSILGAENSLYKKYLSQIRKEYKVFPDIIYNPGRKCVLNHFLNMESIFKTEYFKAKYEKQARANILFELSSL